MFSRRLSLRGSKSSTSSNPQLDFSPKGLPKNLSDHNTATSEELVEAERKRWDKGGGGAVVSEVDWVPDPMTGGQRAVFRPSSTHALGSSSRKKQAEPQSVKPAHPHPKVDQCGATDEVSEEPDDQTPEGRALQAKRVIEAAIEAEQQALELKLKRKG